MKINYNPLHIAMLLDYRMEKFVLELMKNRAGNPDDLSYLKRRFAQKYKTPLPTNIEILKSYRNLIDNKRIRPQKLLEDLLKTRGVRSLSGIAVISVLTKPHPCPGKCLYCPTVGGMPKSYLPNEPAVMRAVLCGFDPYKQVETRIRALQLTGHPTDKIELIVIGGTWSYLPHKYQTWFIGQCFKACNEFFKPKKSKSSPAKIFSKNLGGQVKNQKLTEIQKGNEEAQHRIIGITIETRPDFIDIEEIKWLRKLGVTRVELGAQSIYNDVLKLNSRGHDTAKTIEATKLLKDAGFKICYHMMPGLPGSTPRRDEKMFAELFKNPGFQPDLLKIYPCVVLKEARLYRLWKEKKYRPYSCGRLQKVLTEIKKQIPYYVRIQRLIRDIPSSDIVAGCKISNLRQILTEKAKKEGWNCKCVRCREIKGNYNQKEKIELFRQDYEASDGKEIFLSFEDQTRKHIYGLLRLRIPQSPSRNKVYLLPVLKNSAIIREVHTYGPLVPIDQKNKNAPQHKGLGKALISRAELIAKKEFCLEKIAVISGVGVRDYYRKLGYKLKETYMIKALFK